MKSYNLNIAGYNIRFESSDDGPELIPSERFLGYICFENDPVITIRVHTGKFYIPGGASLVFNAPYVEEINGMRLKKNEEFWSVFKHDKNLFIKTIFPNSGEKEEAILQYSLTGRIWDIWFTDATPEIDPMAYPLDGLILYYLTVIHGDIMIHASGALYSSHGYLFSGISGKGKTTMTKLWDKHGAKVIHDDRLILRKKEKSYFMHNTPVYNNDVPYVSRIDKIFLIEHGTKNELIPVSGAECVSLVMANCIQHNWDPEIIARLLDSVSMMTESLPVAKLYFRPDYSIVDFILEDERR
jgi:hypothetical protein